MSDIEQKTFTTVRKEWWVPTGTYPERGADYVELTKAIHWATQELKSAGRHFIGNSPADNAITVHPHDEHVVIRVEFDRENG